jgi:hypothetical protein
MPWQAKTVKLAGMKPTRILLSMFATILCGCSVSTEEQYAMHDTKYRSLGAAGVVVDAGDGQCVEDTITGLTWEMKTDEPGLHDWHNRYTWFNPHENNDELDYRGVEDGGECAGSSCDTWNFVLAVNDKGLCGYKDWRMPTRNELYSISDQRRVTHPPTANIDYFPFMQADEYWTGFDYAMQYESAWAWNFIYGHDRVDWKRTPKYVRLVRGQAIELREVKE